MKILLPFFVLMLASATVFGQKNFIDQNLIEVTAKAEMSVVPDRIYLKIELSDDDRTMHEQDDAEATLIAKLKSGGIDTDNNLVIRRTGAMSTVKSATRYDHKALFVLCVNSQKEIQTVLELLRNTIADVVTIDRVDHSRIKELKDSCMTKAVNEAWSKASLLASTSHQVLGRALLIEELAPVEPEATSAGYVKISSVFRSGILYSEIKLRYSLRVKYELK